ncbi:glycosyltransferase family 4 protein [Zooshikella harenae]|uniref:Glycosyltransferase family 4 protein n=1 Tax=Zooshikella harenae TaxID=2827238 RepID=A0ABS5Z8K5_9GAMM|nr:glycosyltransferase family 4 protein [Zooshikella harenae]MBU2710248.1 glycosyltransferase family 4 protein [Zooshikella harenae]
MNGRKKILIITSTFPRWDGDIEPYFVESFAKELSKKHKIDILSPHFKKSKIFEEKDYGRIFRFVYFFPFLERLSYNGGVLSNLKKNKFKYFLIILFVVMQFFWVFFLQIRCRYNVINAHWIIPQGLIAVLIKKIMPRKIKPKVLCTSHGGDLFSLKSRMLTQLKGYVLKNCDGITVVSEYMCKVVKEMVDIDDSKIFVGPMGVDLKNKFVFDRSIEKQNLIFVGRLVEKKGLVYLVKAIDILRNKYPNILLNVVGDGPLYGIISELISELDLKKNIKLLGAKKSDEVSKLLKQSKISITPSIVTKEGDQEGLGLVIIEALGCGCAVIVSDLPAIHDIIIDHRTGLFSKPGDPRSIADNIELLLTNDELMNSLAENGRKYVVDKFGWKNVGLNYFCILDKMN